MFSNNLIQKLANNSDEERLCLSEADWHLVLNANKQFSTDSSDMVGNEAWARYLLGVIDQESVDFYQSLELCCGAGFIYFSLREFLDRSSSSYHVDLSESQLRTFKDRAGTQSVTTTILRGDIGRLPFRDGVFKLVYGHSFLHHLPDVSIYLAEVYRVLDHSGRFIAFHEPTATAPFLESFPRSLIRKLERGSLTDIWLIKPEVITRILREVGFSSVSIIPNGLAAAFFVTPFQLVLAKIGLQYQNRLFVAARALCNRLDRFLPLFLRLKYAPSIAIIAKK